MARKILLADDSVTAQNMGRKILSDAGYDVVTVNNGSAALKRVTEQRPDLIVLDVYMPGYSGLEVCQRLKDSPDTESIPILLTVGKLEPFKPEEARRVRAEAYIVKPFEASELLSVLTRLEDQIVPGHGRSSGNGRSENHGDSETGWKNRLRFPAKKKKEEAEPEPDADFVSKSGSRDGRRRLTPVARVEKSAVAAIPDIPRDITPEELDALSALAAKLDGEPSGSQSAAPAESIPSAATKEFEVAAPAAEEAKSSVASSAPTEVAEAKPAAEVPASTPVPAAEAKQPEVVPVQVETLVEKEPAPVDKNDEPMFAAAVAATEPAAAEKLEVKQELAAVETPASADATATAEAKEKTEERTTPVAEATQAEPPKAEPAPSAPAVQAKEEQEAPAPSEAELAEALRLLTPSVPGSSSVPSHETLAAAGAALAEEAARNAAAVGQWMAVAVAVDPEEASRSLEAEMFQTLAHPAAGGDSSTVKPAAESSSAAIISKEDASAAVRIVESAPAIEKTEDAAVEEPAAVTFADAVRRDDEPTKSEPVAKDSVTAASLPDASTTTISNSNVAAGGDESMGKENGKSGKSNWHQIRTATPAAKDALEAAKQAETEEAPKAMAAAADGTRTAPTDPTAIANIVDSVLADLRPKIVEEISKKLAGK